MEEASFGKGEGDRFPSSDGGLGRKNDTSNDYDSSGSDALPDDSNDSETLPQPTLESLKENKSLLKQSTTARSKPTDMPRRPLSAYNIFFREQRELIIEERTRLMPPQQPQEGKKRGRCKNKQKKQAKISFEELAKLIGARWKMIDPQELKRLKAMSEADANRYRLEIKEYRQASASSSSKSLSDCKELVEEEKKPSSGKGEKQYSSIDHQQVETEPQLQSASNPKGNTGKPLTPKESTRMLPTKTPDQVSTMEQLHEQTDNHLFSLRGHSLSASLAPPLDPLRIFSSSQQQCRSATTASEEFQFVSFGSPPLHGMDAARPNTFAPSSTTTMFQVGNAAPVRSYGSIGQQSPAVPQMQHQQQDQQQQINAAFGARFGGSPQQYQQAKRQERYFSLNNHEFSHQSGDFQPLQTGDTYFHSDLITSSATRGAIIGGYQGNSLVVVNQCASSQPDEQPDSFLRCNAGFSSIARTTTSAATGVPQSSLSGVFCDSDPASGFSVGAYGSYYPPTGSSLLSAAETSPSMNMIRNNVFTSDPGSLDEDMSWMEPRPIAPDLNQQRQQHPTSTTSATINTNHSEHNQYTDLSCADSDVALVLREADNDATQQFEQQSFREDNFDPWFP